MSADNLALALMALDDAAVRDRVRNNDLSAIGVDLSAKEEALLKAAADEDDDPEVAGFDASASAFYAAASTVPGNLVSGTVANNFKSFVSNKFGGIGSTVSIGCACPPKKGMA